jgi:hypothetical protein
MPTLDEWERALHSPRLVSIDSSPQLITDIQQRQVQQDARLAAQGRPPAQRKPHLTPVSGLPLEVLIEPVQLLHRMGVVTTPAVENLADVCSWWAYIRYLWAFEFPSGHARDRLRLSQPALSIDFHQKGLMSDHIGVGMAALLMSMFLGAPHASDVSVVMKDPAWPVDLAGSASPDYLFSNADQSILYVVECKGTRCSRTNALDQLRRGTEQVPALIFTDGRPQPPSLVIGTHMSGSFVRVYVVDPPSDDLPAEQLPKKVGEREWRIPKGKVVEDAARHVSQAKVLSYAGLDEAAATKVEQLPRRLKEFPRTTPRETVLEENEFGTFRGVRQLIPSRDNLRVEIFQAVRESILEAYTQDDVDRIREEIQRLESTASIERAGSDVRGIARDQRGSSRTIRSFSSDGTLLEIRITPP